MSFQAYLDTVKEQTGKTVADFRALAAKRGLTKHGEIVAWLKQEFGLGYGHATAVAAALLRADPFKSPKGEKVEAIFSGRRAIWRGLYDTLWTTVGQLGDDLDIAPTDSYVSLRRSGRKFAIVQPGAAFLDLGIKRRGVEPTERFQVAGSWNSMVTHRVRLTDAAQIDTEVLDWLRAAYQNA